MPDSIIDPGPLRGPAQVRAHGRGALSAVGLRKSFGDKTGLDGIDPTVAEGTIFALLGPNGAGKTTTVQILSTLITAASGL
jgi:ABC-2 type transport system ATP-binding protein